MTPSGRPVRRAIAAVAVTCIAALITGCGGGSPSAAPTVTVTQTVTAPASSPASTAPAAPPSPAGPQPCPTSALQAKIGPGQGAAGSFYYAIDFTNASSTRCALYGYPGVSFVTGLGGSQIGPAATRSASAATLVTLAPGAIAHATLRVVDAGVYPPSKCTIVTARWLKVYPPNQFTALYISFSAQTCAGGAHATNILSVQTAQTGA